MNLLVKQLKRFNKYFLVLLLLFSNSHLLVKEPLNLSKFHLVSKFSLRLFLHILLVR